MLASLPLLGGCGGAQPAGGNGGLQGTVSRGPITPTCTPGHVFSVFENGTFTNLNVEAGAQAFQTPFSDGDLPVSDVVRDDARHTLYVGTDFGVLEGVNDGASWHVTRGMPRYEIMHLEIQPSNRVPTCTGGGGCRRILYAATHSQGIWKMNLGG